MKAAAVEPRSIRPLLKVVPIEKGRKPGAPRWVSWWAAGMLALSAALVAAGIGARDAVVKVAAPRACATAPVVRGPIAGVLRVPGRLAVESTVRVGSSLPGQVVAVTAAVGARVAKGDVLARLDDAEQRTAAVAAGAHLASAELLAIRAERELLAELESMRERGLPPEAPDVDELLEGKAGDAQLEYLHNAAQIDRHEAALALARKLRARRIIRAPMDGVVLARNVEPGETIPASPPGPALFVIGSDPARLRIEAEVDERYLQAVLPGPVTFTVPAHGGYLFSGTVRQVVPSPTATRSPASHLVLLDAANPDGALQPGMSATVELGLAAGHDTLSVPNEAIVRRSDSTTVWLANDVGGPTPMTVTPGIANEEFTEIAGAGLAAGRIVIRDASPSTCIAR